MNRLERPAYLPTPREIASQCAAIRRRWTPSERQRRTVGYGLIVAETVWTPPHIITAQCMSRVRKFVSDASA